MLGWYVMERYCSSVEVMVQMMKLYVDMFAFPGFAVVRSDGNDTAVVDHDWCRGHG